MRFDLKSNVVVVSLDFNRNVKSTNKVYLDSVEYKLQMLRWRIIETCETLKISHPEAAWIIAWPEYGIKGTLGNCALTAKQKKDFKVTLSQLTQTYPNLTIIAGTIQSTKFYDDKRKLEKVISYYKNNAVLFRKESGHLLAKLNIDMLRQEYDRVMYFKKNFPIKGFHVIRNTCFVFNGNEIWQHDKSTPVSEVCNCGATFLHDEDCKNGFVPRSIYQTAKPSNISPLYTFVHPITQRPIRVGIDICNEHFYGGVKTFAKDPVDIHFVISDSIYLLPKNFYGAYIVQCDTKRKPNVISLKESHLSLIFIRASILKAEHLDSLKNPTPSFIEKVLEILDDAIKSLENDSQRRIALQNMHDVIQEKRLLCIRAKPLYQLIGDLLILNKPNFILRGHHFFPREDLTLVYQELVSMLKDEKAVHPKFLDIHAKIGRIL